MTSTRHKHTDPDMSAQIGSSTNLSLVVNSGSLYSSELGTTTSTTRSISIITQTPRNQVLTSASDWPSPNDDSNSPLQHFSSSSFAQRNFPSVTHHIPRITEQRLSSSPASGVLTLPSLAASPTSSTLSTSPNSLLFNSPSLILSNNPPFSTSIGLMANNIGGGLSSPPPSPPYQRLLSSRSRSRSRDAESFVWSPPTSPVMQRGKNKNSRQNNSNKVSKATKKMHDSASEKIDQKAICNARALNARKENDSMVYLDGPRIYTCGECRTHLTSHDEIISKSFHGRHGRAYLFDQCVNYTVGTAEDRRLITGLHSVCDIFCKRCKTLIGWTYAKAYEPHQKYKEGKFIIEKINLHMEESGNSYEVNHPAGERRDRWRIRSMSWGSEESHSLAPSLPRADYSENPDMVWEYQHGNTSSISSSSNKVQLGQASLGQSSDVAMMPPVPPKL
eukprot:CAMPEP_0198251364 /NCGR_PEP_ID=MMETSP1447-20131203/2212_1 /TAXON_ID=420782 /ORGANISM="Chaetoceros dichaeta, Strain CCMP1751" /LENGTH=446 /DNA_ID=CAMNT_0043936355 /DNA_START=259 /DNA_END=1599 /DNA_ORIENTATION=+